MSLPSVPHLDPERLAALADEPPTADEAAHLATCLACRRERGAHQALLALVRELGPDAEATDAAPADADEPLVPWAALAGALRDEGLVRTPEPVAALEASVPLHAPDAGVVALDDVRARRATPAASAAASAAPSRWAGGIRRAAAAVLLLAGGAALGRASVGVAPAAVGPAVAVMPTAAPATGTPVTPEPAAAPDAGAPAGDVAEAPARPAASAARLVSDDGETLVFRSVTEATAVLTRAQRDYQRAAAWLAAHDSTGIEAGGPETLRTRLAALDEVMPSVRQALREAPQDPVLNHVYLTAYDVRESTLRQLGRALPVGVRLEGY